MVAKRPISQSVPLTAGLLFFMISAWARGPGTFWGGAAAKHGTGTPLMSLGGHDLNRTFVGLE